MYLIYLFSGSTAMARLRRIQLLNVPKVQPKNNLCYSGNKIIFSFMSKLYLQGL
jgi:hypothetical protein